MLDVDVATLEMNSGSNVKIAIAAANVTSSMTMMEFLPSSTSSSSAWRFALRISQRVPTIKVSYRTTSPRTNGHLATREAWTPVLRRSVAVTIRPSGWRSATAIASRPRMSTPSMRAWPPYA